MIELQREGVKEEKKIIRLWEGVAERETTINKEQGR